MLMIRFTLEDEECRDSILVALWAHEHEYVKECEGKMHADEGGEFFMNLHLKRFAPI